VLGVYEGGELVYIGHTGGGFDARSLADVYSRLRPLVRRTCPFRDRPQTNAPVRWVEPRLVCEVTFQEWTDDGVMRHPIFLGLRDDKAARSVYRETPRQKVPPPRPVNRPKLPANGEPAPRSSARPRQPAPPSANGTGGPRPVLSNLDKVYWPEEGITKGDLIAYYRALAPVLLPYLRDRPQSLHRHPNGITGHSFFQKDVSKQPPPEWVETVTLPPDSGEKPITYLLCQDEPTLLYVVNLGCIELNPWNARVGLVEYPDYLILDLDPVDVPFARVVEAALAVRRALERAGAESACKTSGKRGLHVCVPLGARYDHDQARRFAEIIAQLVHRQLPDSTSLERRPALRQGRVYLDFLQNRRGQTLVAPYSVRPHPAATVSAPLRWTEVRRNLDPAKFTIQTMGRRLDRVGDLWQPVLGPGIDLTACLERLGGG
jgi:bifunctional non-homologous end joining protein LigD